MLLLCLTLFLPLLNMLDVPSEKAVHRPKDLCFVYGMHIWHLKITYSYHHIDIKHINKVLSYE